MRRILVLALAVLFVSAMIIGCGQSTTPTPPPENQKTAENTPATPPATPPATEQPKAVEPAPAPVQPPAPATPPVATVQEAPVTVTTNTGLQYIDMVVGAGEEAKAGMKVTVHYTGWLTNGSKFDSSVDRGQPFKFTLGNREVIRGWDEGVAGMKVGGKRKLIIPSELGYGARGAGGAIPPNATLVFDVELLGVQ